MPSGSLSPINSLPPELLTKIFTHCSASDPIIHARKNKAPWVLTQVSSTWRQIAIEHSEIWSSIRISVNNPGYPVTWVYSEDEQVATLCDPPLYVVKTYFQRSRASPLTVVVRFQFTQWQNNFPSSIPKKVVRLLHSHMNHIKSLSIQFPESFDPPDPDEPSFPPLFTSPNDLETLHLAHKTQLLSSLTVDAFPRLKHFTWTGVASQVLHLPIPWTQLQTLVLAYDNFNHIVKLLIILNKVPNLISLKISIIERCDTHHCAAAREMDPVEFAQLTELDIKGTPEGLRAFLALIKAPRLTGLSFELYTPLGMDKHEEPKMCGILAMLFQSTKMRSLKLDNLPLPAPLLIRLLKYVSPTLEHLEIQDFPRFDGQVFKAFTVPPNGGDVLCPRLSSLVLKNATYLLMLMPGSYAKLVESRLATAYPLKSLYAIVTVDEFEEDAQRLRELNASGELEYLHWEEWEEDGYIDEW